jgi:hypothetical protein
VGCAIYEYPLLYDTFGRREGLTLFWFWVQQGVLLLAMEVMFFTLLIIDALPVLSRRTKMAVRFCVNIAELLKIFLIHAD